MPGYMDTQYPNGGVSTTSYAQPFPTNFFQMLGASGLQRPEPTPMQEQLQQLALARAKAATVQAQQAANAGGMDDAGWVKQMGGAGMVPGLIQAHQGDPGAHYAGYQPGAARNAVRGAGMVGGGSDAAAGGGTLEDFIRQQKQRWADNSGPDLGPQGSAVGLGNTAFSPNFTGNFSAGG